MFQHGRHNQETTVPKDSGVHYRVNHDSRSGSDSVGDGGSVMVGGSGGDGGSGGEAGDAVSDMAISLGDKLEGAGSAEDDPLHLKRRVGLFSGVALIVGTMIGSGIFVSPSGLLVRTGSVGLSMVVWISCGVLSLLGALAYAELGTMNTSSGAEYAYFMDAFGAPPAFLFSWVSTLVLKPSQMAIICLSFAEYGVEAFVSECEPPVTVVKLVAVLAIALILFINCFSVNLATGVQNAFTAAKLIAILIIICGGAYKLFQGNTQHLEHPFQGTTPSLGNIATAFYTGLWAYDGWNNLNYVTEEIKNPSNVMHNTWGHQAIAGERSGSQTKHTTSRGSPTSPQEPTEIHHDRDPSSDALLRSDQRLLSGSHVGIRDDRVGGSRSDVWKPHPRGDGLAHAPLGDRVNVWLGQWDAFRSRKVVFRCQSRGSLVGHSLLRPHQTADSSAGTDFSFVNSSRNGVVWEYRLLDRLLQLHCVDLLWGCHARSHCDALHQAQRSAALQGAANHSRCGFGNLNVPRGSAHHRQTTNRVPLRGTLHCCRARTIRALRSVQHGAICYG